MSRPDRRLVARPAASERLVTFLALALVPVPIAGWALAQGLTARIAQNSEYTGAYVHTLATSTFAVIFMISAIINAALVMKRDRRITSTYRIVGYPLSQAIVIVLGLAWIVLISAGDAVWTAEQVVGVSIAVGSIITCILATRRDDPASSGGALPRAAPVELTPTQRRTRRAIAIGLPALLVAAVLAIVLIPIRHADCTIQGRGTVNGAESVYTSCGDFSIDTNAISATRADDLFSRHDPVDITTRGFTLLPLLPIAVSIERASQT